MMEEIQAMEFLAEHPHPNIVRYHGCLVRRGCITGLVLDRYTHDLMGYMKYGVGTLNKESFMEALESAINHIHSLGWAHNDLNPGNVMINDLGMPILIDFGSSHPIGNKLSTSRGTEGWIDEEIKNYTLSEKRHDIYALCKIREWLEAPVFED
jgi:serine/threonine protein kinase